MTTGNIILLNGAASADKTKIVQALQAVLPAPYLHLGLAQFSGTLPAAVQTLTGTLGRPNAHQGQLIAGMHHALAALARAGNHVIADHQLIEPGWVRECGQVLADLPVWLVGAHCPLAMVAAHHTCPPEQIQAHVAALHTPGVYDLEVDTSHLSPHECALQIKRHLAEGPPPTAMRWLKVWGDPAKHRGWLRR